MTTTILNLAIKTLIHAASADGFRKVEGAREFFVCADIDTLLEANGEESFRQDRTYPEMTMVATEVVDLCVSVIKKVAGPAPAKDAP